MAPYIRMCHLKPYQGSISPAEIWCGVSRWAIGRHTRLHSMWVLSRVLGQMWNRDLARSRTPTIEVCHCSMLCRPRGQCRARFPIRLRCCRQVPSWIRGWILCLARCCMIQSMRGQWRWWWGNQLISRGWRCHWWLSPSWRCREHNLGCCLQLEYAVSFQWSFPDCSKGCLRKH